jgi:hypothetical protein
MERSKFVFAYRHNKILKTSHEELSDLVSLTNADLETTMNTAKHALSLPCDPKGKFKSCHHDLYMLLITNTTTLDADLPLQLHIRSCKKSDDIIPVKRTGSRPLFPFYQNMHYLCYTIQRENSSRVIMTFTCCWSNWQQAKTLCFLVFHLVNHPLSNKLNQTTLHVMFSRFCKHIFSEF